MVHPVEPIICKIISKQERPPRPSLMRDQISQAEPICYMDDIKSHKCENFGDNFNDQRQKTHRYRCPHAFVFIQAEVEPLCLANTPTSKARQKPERQISTIDHLELYQKLVGML